MRPILSKQGRIRECAEFLQGYMEDCEHEPLEDQLEELLDESVDAAARDAGFTEPEIAAAWAWINEQEGA